MKRLVGFLSPLAPKIFVYMLQQFEYSTKKFFLWFIRFPNLFASQKRGSLTLTARAQFLLVVAYFGWIVGVVACGLALVMSRDPVQVLRYLLAPVFALLLITLVNIVLETIIIGPKHRHEIARAGKKLAQHKGVRIAVIGSYGKTTMKELLATVLAEGKKVAATPGNKNVLISHARWLNSAVHGDEEVLVFEYGEGEPGDIARLASLSQPNIAVITGLAPAHLDYYPSLEAIADDFAQIQNLVKPKDIFMNADSEILMQKIKAETYNETGIGELQVTDVSVAFSGTRFTLLAGDRKLELQTGLLGKHQIGPICAVVAIASNLGLTDEQIVAGVAKTTPFEHRMQARQLHGAWIVDDTYNGNIEGMRAGLKLLSELPGQKKIYVTPGLVDQGTENESVHRELGALIAGSNPDKVVLMQNSVTAFIQTGLTEHNYSGEVVLESNPLDYYMNLEHHVAAGDVVMLQNDWPDSYQ